MLEGFYLVLFSGARFGVSRWDGQNWRTTDGRDLKDYRPMKVVRLIEEAL